MLSHNYIIVPVHPTTNRISCGLCMCMCVCYMHVCVCTCIHMCTRVHIHVCVHVCVCVHVHMSMNLCICLYIHVHVGGCVCACVHGMRACVCVCVCVCPFDHVTISYNILWSIATMQGQPFAMRYMHLTNPAS